VHAAGCWRKLLVVGREVGRDTVVRFGRTSAWGGEPSFTLWRPNLRIFRGRGSPKVKNYSSKQLEGLAMCNLEE
jgi:hypothetical protein